jgi:uncharacterized protein
MAFRFPALFSLPLGLALLLCCAPVQAEVLERIDLAARADEAEVTIRFSHRIRYLRHEPAGEAKDLRVFMKLIDSPLPEGDLMQETLPSPANERLPAFSVVFPERRNGLLIRFAEATPYQLRPGKDGRSIVLRLPWRTAAKGEAATPADPPATASSTRQASVPLPAAPSTAASAAASSSVTASTTASATASAAPAESRPLPVNIGPTRIAGASQSIKSRRDAGVVKQAYDYSCGAAAMATLLTYGLADPVSESEVLTEIIGRLASEQAAQVEKSGLSLLDLQQFAQRRGYRAQGFRIAADQVRRLSRPVLVFIRPLGYEHFAILKGVQGDRVLLADPSQGNWRMPLHRFLDMWLDGSGQGIVLAVEPADRRWPAGSPLLVPAGASRRPELLSLQQMLGLRPAPSPPTPVLNP